MLDNVTPIEFERICAELIKKMGFEVETTKITGDGGIDIIAYNEQPMTAGKYIVQCKRYGGSVGEPIIRDLYGTTMGVNANKGILLTTGTFTKSAQEFAKNKQIELIDGKMLESLLIKHKMLEQEIKVSQEFMANFKDYKEYLVLEEYLKNNPTDTKMRLKMIAYVNGKVHGSISGRTVQKGQLSFLSNLCLTHIKKTFINGKSHADLVRKNIVEFIKGNMLFILGEVSDAYSIYTNIVNEIKIIEHKVNRRQIDLKPLIDACIYNKWIIREIVGLDNTLYYKENRVLIKEEISSLKVFSEDFKDDAFLEEEIKIENPDEVWCDGEWYKENWMYFQEYMGLSYGCERNPIYDIYNDKTESWESISALTKFAPFLIVDKREDEIEVFQADYCVKKENEQLALLKCASNVFTVDRELEKRKILVLGE